MLEIITNFIPFLILVSCLYLAFGSKPKPKGQYVRSGFRLGPFWIERGKTYDDDAR